jgi:hypothetical protein
LTRASGDQEYFTPGTYTVDDEVAGHWFALAHTADPPPPDIKVGTRAFVHTQLAEKRREALIAAVDEKQVVDAQEAVRERTRSRPRLGTAEPDPTTGPVTQQPPVGTSPGFAAPV